MTEQQRKDGFLAMIAQAEQLFGVTVQSTVNARQYGAMLQIEPGQIQLALIEGWQPPVELTKEATAEKSIV